MLHHGYRGSITIKSRIGGVRCRVGNVQVGDENLLDEIFPEKRFNGWTVGEVHLLDPRIVPNARRDHFEQNVHFSNLTAQLEPFGRQVGKRARAASIERNNARRAQQSATALPEGRLAHDSPAALPADYVSSSSSKVSLEAHAAQDGQASPPLNTAKSGRFNPSQQRLLRKISSLVQRSGLSNQEIRALLSYLRDRA